MKYDAHRSIVQPFFVGMLCMAMGMLMGCAGSKMAPEAVAPWHLRPSGAYDIQQERVFYGVGMAAPLQNRALQRVSADNKARQELAGILEQFGTALVRATALDPSGGFSGANDLIPSLKGVVHQAMKQAMIVEHWFDPKQGRMLALCRLGLADFKNALEAYREISAEQRSAMLAHLVEVHDRLVQDLYENQ